MFKIITFFIAILLLTIGIAHSQNDLRSSSIQNGDNTYILRIQNDSVIAQDILWIQDTSFLKKENYTYSPANNLGQSNEALQSTIWLQDNNEGTYP